MEHRNGAALAAALATAAVAATLVAAAVATTLALALALALVAATCSKPRLLTQALSSSHALVLARSRRLCLSLSVRTRLIVELIVQLIVS